MGTGAAAYGAGALINSTGTQLAGGMASGMGKNILKSDLAGLKGGLFGAAANLIIGESTDMWEKSYEDKAKLASDNQNDADRNNNIGVISIQ